MVTRILAEVLLVSVLLGMVWLFYRTISRWIDGQKEEKKKESKTQGSE